MNFDFLLYNFFSLKTKKKNLGGHDDSPFLPVFGIMLLCISLTLPEFQEYSHTFYSVALISFRFRSLVQLEFEVDL